MPHRGAWESHVQGEAVQVDGLVKESARDVQLLNRCKAATGEPCDAETVTHGSEAGRQKSTREGNSPVGYPTRKVGSWHPQTEQVRSVFSRLLTRLSQTAGRPRLSRSRVLFRLFPKCHPL